jgi:hypothetical protein
MRLLATNAVFRREIKYQWPTKLTKIIKKNIEYQNIINTLKKVKPYLLSSFKKRGIVPTILKVLNKILKRTLPTVLVLHGYSPLTASIAEMIPYKSLLDFVWKKGRYKFIEFKRGQLYTDKEALIKHKAMMRKISNELGIGTTENRVISLRKGEQAIETSNSRLNI